VLGTEGSIESCLGEYYKPLSVLSSSSLASIDLYQLNRCKHIWLFHRPPVSPRCQFPHLMMSPMMFLGYPSFTPASNHSHPSLQMRLVELSTIFCMSRPNSPLPHILIVIQCGASIDNSVSFSLMGDSLPSRFIISRNIVLACSER